MKRVIDIMFAVIGLVVLSPIMIVVAVVIWSTLGLPIFYRQVRPGKHCKAFTLIKFRTMRDSRNADGNLLSDRERLTRLGAALRRLSLDELPEFWNVLVGDMSLVGPRPLLTRYLPYYTAEERKRHDVRPGITGLAQVSGRNFLNWDERLALDIEYVKNQTLILDLNLLWLTLRRVITREGVAIDTQIAMQDLDDERKNKRYISKA